LAREVAGGLRRKFASQIEAGVRSVKAPAAGSASNTSGSSSQTIDLIRTLQEICGLLEESHRMMANSCIVLYLMESGPERSLFEFRYRELRNFTEKVQTDFERNIKDVLGWSRDRTHEVLRELRRRVHGFRDAARPISLMKPFHMTTTSCPYCSATVLKNAFDDHVRTIHGLHPATTPLESTGEDVSGEVDPSSSPTESNSPETLRDCRPTLRPNSYRAVHTATKFFSFNTELVLSIARCISLNPDAIRPRLPFDDPRTASPDREFCQRIMSYLLSGSLHDPEEFSSPSPMSSRPSSRLSFRGQHLLHRPPSPPARRDSGRPQIDSGDRPYAERAEEDQVDSDDDDGLEDDGNNFGSDDDESDGGEPDATDEDEDMF
jgi:hypothetical protein